MIGDLTILMQAALSRKSKKANPQNATVLSDMAMQMAGLKNFRLKRNSNTTTNATVTDLELFPTHAALQTSASEPTLHRIKLRRNASVSLMKRKRFPIKLVIKRFSTMGTN